MHGLHDPRSLSGCFAGTWDHCGGYYHPGNTRELEAPEREATPGVMKVENDVVEIVDSEDEVEVAPRRIKVEEPEVNADSQVQSGSNDRGKKRKALEAEFEQIEEEERLVDLRQRKRRVREELALLEEWTRSYESSYIV